MRYFAYGSNMCAAAMERACPGHRFLGAACLRGHRLAFTRRSIVTGTGVADVVAADGHDVWGALHELRSDSMELLDRKEGRGFAYERCDVVVFTHDSAACEAVAYSVIDKETVEVRPSKAYLQLLVDGALERGLPAEYVRELERAWRPAHRPRADGSTPASGAQPS